MDSNFNNHLLDPYVFDGSVNHTAHLNMLQTVVHFVAASERY
jgi:hypothetical protein